jgi:Ca2+-dependent lipid-binding protein
VVCGTKGLRAEDTFSGFSDPYVVAYFNGERIDRTETVAKTLSPVLDAQMSVAMPPEGGELRLEIFDDDAAAWDDFLGELSVLLSRTALERLPRSLTGRGGVGESRGSLTVWLGEPGCEPVAEAPATMRRTLTVSGAKGLRKADTFGKSDPSAVVWVDNVEVDRTEVVQSNLSPAWAEARGPGSGAALAAKGPAFAFECAVDGSSRLKVVVWDHDKSMRADHLGELEMALEPRGFHVRSQSAAPSPSATQPPRGGVHVSILRGLISARGASRATSARSR